VGEGTLNTMYYPLLQEILYQDPLAVFSVFSQQANVIFLDSAYLMDQCGRYSFIAVDPFFTVISKNSCEDPFQLLQDRLAQFPLYFYPELPPFQGGAAGFFSYDLLHHLEMISRTKDDLGFPDLAMGFYDLVIGFDNLIKQAWIFSSGYPEQNKLQREKRAKKRLNWIAELLSNMAELPSINFTTYNEADIQTTFSKKTYKSAVQKVKDYILAGDIFEANISQRFSVNLRSSDTAFELYRRLRLINPAPFSAYLNIGDTIIISASPERFLKLTGRLIETRPIKGTRPRGKTKSEDDFLSRELLHSEKDRAENVMIVDLLRNDLSRVCEDYSVSVSQLCGLESYATVHHLVSVVTGLLQEKYNAIDLLRVAFPGGSITGAPKVRAMEIINEIEPTTRGPYCGSIGYMGFNGDMDCSIVIRTFAIKNNILTFQTGGAVTVDSDPEEEYEETLTKARALRRVLVEKNFPI
jgi:para-aminobenzoate synthetase component 1